MHIKKFLMMSLIKRRKKKMQIKRYLKIQTKKQMQRRMKIQMERCSKMVPKRSCLMRIPARSCLTILMREGLWAVRGMFRKKGPYSLAAALSSEVMTTVIFNPLVFEGNSSIYILSMLQGNYQQCNKNMCIGIGCHQINALPFSLSRVLNGFKSKIGCSVKTSQCNENKLDTRSLSDLFSSCRIIFFQVFWLKFMVVKNKNKLLICRKKYNKRTIAKSVHFFYQGSSCYVWLIQFISTLSYNILCLLRNHQQQFYFNIL